MAISPIILTRFNKMIQRRKALFYSRADVREYHCQTQTYIPHDRSSHQSSSFVLYGFTTNICLNQVSVSVHGGIYRLLRHVIYRYVHSVVEINWSYLSVNVWAHVYCYWIRPWNRTVLVPPPLHYYGYIKSQNKRQRYQVAVCFTIIRYAFKYSWIKHNSRDLKCLMRNAHIKKWTIKKCYC